MKESGVTTTLYANLNHGHLYTLFMHRQTNSKFQNKISLLNMFPSKSLYKLDIRGLAITADDVH